MYTSEPPNKTFSQRLQGSFDYLERAGAIPPAYGLRVIPDAVTVRMYESMMAFARC